VYQALPLQKKYRLAPFHGVCLLLLITVIDAGAVYSQDIKNDRYWFGHHLNDSKALFIRLEEPLVEKPASWKALAAVQSLYKGNKLLSAKGQLIIYFKKDSLPPALRYGSRIVVSTPCKELKTPAIRARLSTSAIAFFRASPTRCTWRRVITTRFRPLKPVRSKACCSASKGQHIA
jgi:hypothetical protein